MTKKVLKNYHNLSSILYTYRHRLRALYGEYLCSVLNFAQFSWDISRQSSHYTCSLWDLHFSHMYVSMGHMRQTYIYP
jgi:hypothetical protein